VGALPNSDYSDMIFLLAAERSGTHFVRSLVQNTGFIFAPGEVCNANADASEHNPLSFFQFRADAVRKLPELALPTPSNQYELLDLYFNSLSDCAPKSQRFMCDIKYSHIHNFNNFWWDLFSVPFLLDFARRRSVSIVHLVRRKIFQTAVSELYASQSGVWRTEHAPDVVMNQIFVDLPALKRKARTLSFNINLMNEWLCGCRHIVVSYESLSGDPIRAVNEILAFLGLGEVASVHSDYQKTTPSYNIAIKNYDEVEPFLNIDLDTVQNDIDGNSIAKY